jgi:hypothetical protein
VSNAPKAAEFTEQLGYFGIRPNPCFVRGWVALSSVRLLNSLLADELALIATCDGVRSHLATEGANSEVSATRDIHARRADALRERIAGLQGDPLRRPSVASLLRGWVERMAFVGGERGVLALLRQHEARLAERYREVLPQLDPETRDVLDQPRFTSERSRGCDAAQ